MELKEKEQEEFLFTTNIWKHSDSKKHDTVIFHSEPHDYQVVNDPEIRDILLKNDFVGEKKESHHDSQFPNISMNSKQGGIYRSQGRSFSTNLLFDSYDPKKVSDLKLKEKEQEEFLFTTNLWKHSESK
jgi:hypothetical protein